MAGNICGNCANFKPKAGDKFFNCTSARQGGIAYGMQVRADTRACEAFTTLARASTPRPTETKAKPAAKPAPGAAPKTGDTPPGKRVEATQRPRGLCAWGRVILIVSIVIVLALLSWGIYTCTSLGGGGPAPTPTPTGPVATPTLQNFGSGQWAETSIQRLLVVSTTIATSYRTKLGEYAPPEYAPPGTWFVLVEASTIYLGNTSMVTTPGDFVLMDAEDYQYKYDVYQGPKPYPSVTLSTGQRTAGGTILFTVPAGASGLKVSCLLQGDQPVQAVWKLQ